MNILKKIITLTALISSMFYFGCSKPNEPDVSGDGSQTGNVALVSGYLYNADGTPAKNAKVYFITSDHLPSVSKSLAKSLATMAVGDSTTTDSTGWFGLDSIPVDTYNVFGQDTAGDVSYQDSVIITGDSQVVDPDTLDLPGSLAGYVKMEPGDDPRTITMYVIGATKYALPELDASFSLADMAEGTYRVRILSTLDKYLPLDTTLTINAGEDLNLPDSIILPLKIPKITGFTVDYDTLKQIVNLSWDKGDTSRIKGYNVYRQHIDSTAVKLNVQALTDTFYVDSTGVQDETYIYSVVGVDLNSDEGTKVSGDSLTLVGSFELVATFGNGEGTSPSYFRGLGTIEADYQGNIFCADVADHRIQKFDSAGNYVLEWGGIGNAQGEFEGYIYDIAIDSLGNVYAVDGDSKRIQKFDNNGTFIREWNAEGSIDSSVVGNFRITIHNDFVYVGNTDRIQKFDLEGNFIQNIDIAGNASFMGIVATDNLVYIATYFVPGKILKVMQDGSSVDTIFVGSATSGSYEIRSMSFDYENNILYFINFDSHQIVGITPDGAVVSRYSVNLSDVDNFESDIAMYYSNNTLLLGRYKGYIEKYRVISP